MICLVRTKVVDRTVGGFDAKTHLIALLKKGARETIRITLRGVPAPPRPRREGGVPGARTALTFRPCGLPAAGRTPLGSWAASPATFRISLNLSSVALRLAADFHCRYAR